MASHVPAALLWGGMRCDFKLIGRLTPEQEAALEAVTQGLVHEILHAPLSAIRQAAARPDHSAFIGLARRVFHLEEEPAMSAGRGS